MTIQNNVGAIRLLSIAGMLVAIPQLGIAQEDVRRERLTHKLRKGILADEVLEKRRQLTGRLITIVSDESATHEIRVRAAKLLGRMRARKAVPTLIKHLSSIIPESVSEKTIETIFPCIPPLVDIGKPSANAVLIELRKPMEDYRRLALVTVLLKVEGRKVSKFRLQDALASRRVKAERKCLLVSLNTLARLTSK